MKTRHSLRMLATAWMLAASLAANAVTLTADYFPDENFRSQVIYLTGLAPGSVIPNDILMSIKTINVSNNNISSLVGVTHFSNLESLDCSNNNLTELDLKGLHYLTYLNCNYNQIGSLDIRSTDVLKTLKCRSNKLTSLDLQHERELITLDLYGNLLTVVQLYYHHAMTSINVGNNPNLSDLYLSRCPELTQVICNNTSIIELDLSNAPLLTKLNCEHCYLTELDLSNNPQLTMLDCAYNTLGMVDVNDKAELGYLDCRSCSLTKLVLPEEKGNLQVLYCSNNHLERLNVSEYVFLTTLYCGNNHLTMLDLSSNTKLTDVSINQGNSFEMDWWTAPGFSHDAFIPLHGHNLCFNTSRFQNLTVLGLSGTQEPCISFGYLKIPWINTSSTTWESPSKVFYDFNTGNEVAGNMHVNIQLAQNMGVLQPVGSVHITDYDLPQDFEPGDHTASTDVEGAVVTLIEYIMFNKVIQLYEGTAGERVGIRMRVELPDGFFWNSPDAFIGTLQQNHLINTNDQKAIGFYWLYDVPEPEGGLYIRSVSETIEEPAVGASPAFQTESMMETSTTSANRAKPTYVRNYTVTGVVWAELNLYAETVEDYVIMMDEDDIFQPNKLYSVFLMMEPKEGWQFHERTECRLNNIKCNTESNPMFNYVLNLDEAMEGLFNFDGPAIAAAFILEGPDMPTAISDITTRSDDTWYTLSGVRLNAMPTRNGIYIHNGKKVVVK